ncbi:uncharacterized protein LOC126445894 [Schistocerca serialis cubense]|uniref:uncharacterized protein LOC126445894 n=1 Tax=Schistocerca serialis cubense TaxID=2023355 RepID=UPI00214F563A|nr:uncharacterized protein LOC126445894 [Schistocerca serialis cubense]
MYYNYKKYFSLALVAVADANCRLIAVNIGGYGKQSGGGTFRASKLYNNILNGTENWPPPKELPGTSVKALLVLVGDEAFPLLEKLMRPYPGLSLTEEERLFNRRLSRARTVVERTFGIMASKWRLLRKEIETSVEHADIIIQCICVLHNIIIDEDGPDISFQLSIDQDITEHNALAACFQNDRANSSASRRARNVREAFKNYVNSH